MHASMKYIPVSSFLSVQTVRKFIGMQCVRIAKRAKSKNRMQITESPRGSDNISVFRENLDENKRQILV